MIVLHCIMLLLCIINMVVWGVINQIAFWGVIFAILAFILFIVILIKDLNIKDNILETKDKISNVKYNTKTTNDDNYNNNSNSNYEENIVSIDLNKIIIFLLIVIIIIMLYSNGFFYKFKIVSEDNLDKILSTKYLTEEEKAIITTKYFIEKNKVIGKMIYQILK